MAVKTSLGLVVRNVQLRLRELKPKTREERAAHNALRVEINRLPVLDASGMQTSEWTRHRQALRDAIRRRDPRWFKSWQVIRYTMNASNHARYVDVERRALAAKGAAWASFAEEGDANRVHLAYHLAEFEEATQTRIGTYGSVTEFGGGYGAMSQLVRELGMQGPYAIFDLPEFAALQRYFLTTRGIRGIKISSNTEDFVRETVMAPIPRLFIATWSLSEAPLATRHSIEHAFQHFHAFLIGYQATFSGIDNRAYFEQLQRQIPQVRWQTVRLNHIPGDSSYLFGSSQHAGIRDA